MTVKVVCCYPSCDKEATKTAVFGAETGDEVLGQVPLCDEHYEYVQRDANGDEVLDLFGPPKRFIPHLTHKVKEVWGEEV